MTDHDRPLPPLIQGGMGAAISSWPLARAVAERGQLGVVSATAIERVVACRLQEGDPGGHLRRALGAFPDRGLAARVLRAWYRPDGLAEAGSYRGLGMWGERPSTALLELTVAAAFAEVWLAKEDHAGPVGINLLTKIQPPTLPTLYGAMLAGIDVVLMGAGIPRDIPGHLDRLAQHQPCALRLLLEDGDTCALPFDPGLVEHDGRPLRRPRFLAVVSSQVLAASLARAGGVDGFVVEHHCAGGHNAPPRGWKGEGEMVYGERDVADLERIRALGLPYWLAGGRAEAGAIAAAQALGAEGVQIGTPFAFCRESGMAPALRRRALEAILAGEAVVRTEGRSSPTGFPFKLLELAGTEGGRDPGMRQRQPCLLGYLRSAFRREDGRIGWRCPAEPERDYLAKGGEAADCAGRRCLCNGLLATAGHPHALQDGSLELPMITAGDRLDLQQFAEPGGDYDAAAVMAVLGV